MMRQSYANEIPMTIEVQSTRRLWVSLLYGGWAGAIVAWSIGMPLHGAAQTATWIATGLCALAALIGFAKLMARTPINAPNLEDAVLDERLVQMRDAAMRTAYRLLYVAVSLAGAALFTLVLVNPLGCAKAFTINRTFFAFTSLFSAVFLPLILPTTLIAWTAPDPPADEL